MTGDGRCRRTRNRSTSTTSREAAPYFDTSFHLGELMRLTPTDFDQLDDLDEDPEGVALWWFLTRQIWAEQDDQAVEGRRS